MATKVDYNEIERRYVTTTLSLRSLSREFVINHSTLAKRARDYHWRDKRMAYQRALSMRSYEHAADAAADDVATVRRESVIAARATIKKYVQQLVAENVTVTPKDAVAMIEVLAKLLTEPEASADDDRTLLPVGGRPDAEFLRRVAEAARRRVNDAGVLEGTPPIGSTGTRLN